MEPWQRIDRATDREARALLQQCCGSTAWVEAMVGRRPFGSAAALAEAADAAWWSLTPDHWKDAFSHHPKIGDRTSTGAPAREQSLVAQAPPDVLAALAAANEAYAARFGYIFIVCATGKTAEEMLALLQQRIGNAPDREIRIAAAEQDKITALRLQRL
jgi:2-oxo-4-hydroxy-4-carboxy-5-ureidoimidazoline decarboxylase